MHSKTILLVEDNLDDADLTLRAFANSNIANPVVVVRDGAEALDYFFGTGAYAGRDLTDMPTLVLLDLNLPKIDGIEVLKSLRADPRTRQLPVIVLTTSQEQDEVSSAYESGCNSYLRKPVESVQFSETVKQLGLYWLVWNVPPPECSRK